VKYRQSQKEREGMTEKVRQAVKPHRKKASRNKIKEEE
jgi:hypothetical protein